MYASSVLRETGRDVVDSLVRSTTLPTPVKPARARPHMIAALVFVYHPSAPVLLGVLTGSMEPKFGVRLAEFRDHFLCRARLAESVQVLLRFHIICEPFVPLTNLLAGRWSV